jgi:hypothetical protein
MDVLCCPTYRNKIRLVCTLVWCQEAPRDSGSVFSAYFLCLLLERQRSFFLSLFSLLIIGISLIDGPLPPWPPGRPEGACQVSCLQARHLRMRPATGGRVPLGLCEEAMLQAALSDSALRGMTCDPPCTPLEMPADEPKASPGAHVT